MKFENFKAKQSLIPMAKYVLEKNEKYICPMPYPLEGRADMYNQIYPNRPGSQCKLAGNSKGQFTISKSLFLQALKMIWPRVGY